MEKTQLKRQQLTEQMADHLLENGFSGFTLRSLGAATGTSDRMLLHYFSDKDDLLAATLALVAERLLSRLRQLQVDKLEQPQLIGFLAGLLQSHEILPYTNLWLELTSVAIREGEPYRAVAAQITAAFLDWIKATLKSSPSGHAASSAFILTFVEGLILLNAVGKADEAKRALGWALRG